MWAKPHVGVISLPQEPLETCENFYLQLGGALKRQVWGSFWDLDMHDEDLVLISTVESSKSRMSIPCKDLHWPQGESEYIFLAR